MSSILSRALLALSLLGASVTAQSVPVPRPLGRVLATSDGFTAVSAVRALSNGDVLVNDPGKRQVVLLDSTLHVRRVVADSTLTTARAYGSRVSGLFAFRGDSSLFVDPASAAMIVIDPAGALTRVIAAPSRGDAGYLVGGIYGNPGVDSRGRVVYRRPPGGTPLGVTAQETTFVHTGSDSTPLLRFDLQTRRLDTATFLRIEPDRFQTVRAKSSVSSTRVIDPIPIVDDFSVLPDGRVAIMRGREYRLDVIEDGGTIRRGAKIPFGWERLSDDDKMRIIDSTRGAIEARRAAAAGISLGPAASQQPGGTLITTTMNSATGEQTVTNGTRPAGAPPPFGPLFPELSQLSDYRPAFASGAARTDLTGRTWVRTIGGTPDSRGVTYDVIGAEGVRVDRVIVPFGTTIVGFAPGGTVLLATRDASGTRLMRMLER